MLYPLFKNLLLYTVRHRLQCRTAPEFRILNYDRLCKEGVLLSVAGWDSDSHPSRLQTESI